MTTKLKTLKKGTLLRLEASQVFRILNGVVWMTQENDFEDYTFKNGALLKSQGSHAIVEALEDTLLFEISYSAQSSARPAPTQTEAIGGTSDASDRWTVA